MSYVQPNGLIRLLKGIPLDPDYNHTWYFNSLTAQQNEFEKSKYHPLPFSKVSYQRVNKNTIRVAALADNLQGYNYLMFKNNDITYNEEDGSEIGNIYSARWYYAFILKIDYINDRTSEITYEIDKIQTWLPNIDYNFGQCFIERQHQAGNDEVGDNIVDEGVEVGEYVCNKTEHFDLSEQHVLILSTEKIGTGEDSHINSGLAHNGIYSGLKNNPTVKKIRSNRYDFQVFWSTINGFRARISNVTPKPAQANYAIEPDPADPEIPTQTTEALHPKLTLRKTSGPLSANKLFIEVYYDLNDRHIYIKAKQYDDRSQSTPVRINIEDDRGYNWEFDEATKAYRLEFISNVSETINCTCYIDASWYSSTTQDGIEIKDYIDNFKDPSAIVNIFQYPAWIDKNVGTAGTLTDELAKELKPIPMNRLNVINKKCYCYPYNQLVVSNNVGQNAEYRWEDGIYDSERETNVIYFHFVGSRWGTPTVFAYPASYRGMINDYESGITLNNFPNCSWTGDVYKTWWNQNKRSAVLGATMGTLNSALSIAAGIKEGSPTSIISGALSAANSVGSLIAKTSDMKAIPPSSQGQYANDGINNAMGRTGFTFYWMSAKPQNLEIIDSYFQMYGYKQNKVMKPNIHARARYTYIKTNGCIIHPDADTNRGLPAEAEKEITAIFDKGITFWVPYSDEESETPYEIGDYFKPNNRLDPDWNSPI